MPFTGKINENPLRVFFISDYPIAREKDERASASALQIRAAAEELWDLGHDIVMIAPAYVNRPEKDLDVPYFVRSMLFRPSSSFPLRNTTGPRAPFNYPVLDKNPNNLSDLVLWDFDDEMFDTLLSSYMGMFRLTSLIFGEPDVVVTSHAVSPWNYVASNYPLVFFSSESDRLPSSIKGHKKVIIETGIERAYAGVAFSELVLSRMKKGNHGYEVPSGKVVNIPKGVDPTLFGPEFHTTKGELCYRFSQTLEGQSADGTESVHQAEPKPADMRWVVLYSKYDNPTVSQYFLKVASALEESDGNIMPIFITEGEGHYLCEQIDRFRLKRTRIISGATRRIKAWFLNAADRSLVYMGQELPSGEKVGELKLNLLISSQTAVVFKNSKGTQLYFPGRVDPFSTEVIDQTLKDFDNNAADLSGRLRKLVRRYINNLRPEMQFVDDTTGSILTIPNENQRTIAYNPETDSIEIVDGEKGYQDNRQLFDLEAIHDRAEGFACFKAWQLATQRIAQAAATDELPEISPTDQLYLFKEVLMQAGPQVMPLAMQQKPTNSLERLLFKAKAEGFLNSAKLAYGGSEHSRNRGFRLDRIALSFNPYAREAWEKLVDGINQGRSLGTVFKAWQHEILTALYNSQFMHSSDPNAIPDPKRNPNGILSEMARLVGHSTKEVFKYLAEVAKRPREELIDDARKRGPERPSGGSGGDGDRRDHTNELRDAVGERLPSNVIRYSFAARRRPAAHLDRLPSLMPQRNTLSTPIGRKFWTPKP